MNHFDTAQGYTRDASETLLDQFIQTERDADYARINSLSQTPAPATDRLEEA